ncbi:MAG: hypothetical protein AB7S38_13400 [Vulcanimicrobiota bacterium]
MLINNQDPLTRPQQRLKPGQAVREMFVVTSDPNGQAFARLTDGLKNGTVPGGDLMNAIDSFERVWGAEPAGPERELALQRLAQDRASLTRSGASSLPDYAAWLESQEAARRERLEWTQVGAAGTAAIGAFAFVGQMLLGYRLGALGTGLCAASFFTGAIGLNVLDSLKKRGPSLDQAARFHLYAQAAGQRQQVQDLAASLNVSSQQLEIEDEGIRIGQVWVPTNRD